MSDEIDVREFRVSRGWSQQELAARLGVDQATVSRIERGAKLSGPIKHMLDFLKTETPSQESAA